MQNIDFQKIKPYTALFFVFGTGILIKGFLVLMKLGPLEEMVLNIIFYQQLINIAIGIYYLFVHQAIEKNIESLSGHAKIVLPLEAIRSVINVLITATQIQISLYLLVLMVIKIYVLYYFYHLLTTPRNLNA